MRTNCLGTALSNQEHSLRHIKGRKRIARNIVTRAAAVKGVKKKSRGGTKLLRSVISARAE
jgi:hypothetical protein